MILLTADLHLDDKPQNAYRWMIFKVLRDKIKHYGVRKLIILGDLTDNKDNHSSILVNRLVEHFIELLSTGCQIYILKGNHDYIDPDYPYFRFLNNFDRLHYINTPTSEFIRFGTDIKFLLIPHTRDPNKDWSMLDLSFCRYVFLHQTFQGAVASNGVKLDGISSNIFKRLECRVYSGDIHVPQKLGPVEYVGAPYRIHFGDNFQPRMVMLNPTTNKATDIIYPFMKKHKITLSHDDIRFDHEGLILPYDQIKIKLLLPRSEFVSVDYYRDKINKLCDDRQLDLFGIEIEELIDANEQKQNNEEVLYRDNENIFDSFVKHEKIDKYRSQMGKAIIEQ